MICSNCGFNNSENENLKMYFCDNCASIFCRMCAEKKDFNCLKKACQSNHLQLIDENMQYMLFEQGWRHIKKGGFG